MIHVGSTSKLIQGSVLDCSKKGVESALKHYDPQLYLKWNPKKLQGHGCWELRRRPEMLSPVDYVIYQGNTYWKLGYKEVSMIHHVKDFAFINYSIVQWVKDHDLWNYGDKGSTWQDEVQYATGQRLNREEQKSIDEKNYRLKQMKKEVKWFKEYVLSGHNPYRIIDEWYKGSNDS